MDLFTIIGYVGSISFAIYFIHHLFLTTILKKELKPGKFDMIYTIILFILIGIYVVSRKDYPLILLFGCFILWGLLGFMDRKNK
jgi:hypothetical protein